MVDKIWVATKAFIVRDGKVLVVKESSNYEEGTNTGRFDVVGGRLNPGERFDEGLLREIKEETGLTVSIGKPFFVNEWRPEVRGEKWQVVATFFECYAHEGEVQLGDDHDEHKWISPEEFKTQGLIENLHPAFAAFLNRNN